MVEQQQVASGKVSSTIIRQNIARGVMERATQMLSRPYIILGTTSDGTTINDIPEFKMLPPVGTYSAKVNGDDNEIRINSQREITLAKPCAEANVLIEVI